MSVSPSRRGRPRKPKQDQQLRQKLLDTTQSMLDEKAYKSVTVRDIAQRAGTTPAMVNYYFDSKEGLLGELIESTLQSSMGSPTKLAEVLGSPPEQRTRLLLGEFFDVHRNNRWLHRLVVDDVLHEGGTCRALFIGKASAGGKMLRTFIEQQQRDGYFCTELDVHLSAVSLLSLLAFPFLATPVLSEAHGVDMDTIDRERWLDHTAAFIEQGFVR